MRVPLNARTADLPEMPHKAVKENSLYFSAERALYLHEYHSVRRPAPPHSLEAEWDVLQRKNHFLRFHF